MKITDEELRENKILTQRDQAKRQIEGAEIEYDSYKMSYNVAHWLVNHFCHLCPHREA